MIELYHFEPTSNSGEVLICLKEKGIDYVGHYVDVLKGEQFSADFLKLNPAGQVPVLVHDDQVLTETGFILQYLEDVFHAVSLTPNSPEGRYWVNVWIKYVNEHLAPAAWKLGIARTVSGLGQDGRAVIEAALGRAPPERQQAWAKAFAGFDGIDLEIARGLLPERLKRMETALSGSEWLAGDHYSLADIVVFPTVNALPGVAGDLVGATATPRIWDWLERMRSRPAVQAALAEARTEHPEAVFAPGPEGSRWG
jgi:glutathione S-transferase